MWTRLALVACALALALPATAAPATAPAADGLATAMEQLLRIWPTTGASARRLGEADFYRRTVKGLRPATLPPVREMAALIRSPAGCRDVLWSLDKTQFIPLTRQRLAKRDGTPPSARSVNDEVSRALAGVMASHQAPAFAARARTQLTPPLLETIAQFFARHPEVPARQRDEITAFFMAPANRAFEDVVHYQMRTEFAGAIRSCLEEREWAALPEVLLEFTGNRVLGKEQLRAALVATDDSTGGTLKYLANDPEGHGGTKAALDLRTLYYAHGCIDAKVTSPRYEPARTKAGARAIRAIFAIDEGPVYRVGAVTLGGDLDEPAAAQLARLETRSGLVYDRDRMGRDVGRLSSRYRDAGYAYADVGVDIKRDEVRRLIDVALTVRRGPPVRIRQVRITGNRHTPTDFIRRTLGLWEGERFSERALEDARQALKALDLFGTTEVWTRSSKAGGAEGDIDIKVEVEELGRGPLGSP